MNNGKKHDAPRVIGTRVRYVGAYHTWCTGKEVQIVAVLRGGDDGRVLRDDHEIGELEPGDVIEFAPLIEENGVERPSWVTSDATIADLEPL